MVQTQQLPRDIDVALCREASMSSTAIGIGLTHIRQYDFAASGYFYSGMLSFASGLERLAKIILIYDYRLDNQNFFPENNYLKNHGHRLINLINKIREINTNKDLNVEDEFFDDNLYKVIISFLSDFATQSRYYNLDYITNNKQSTSEPLKRWNEQICKEIINRHYKTSKKTENRQEFINNIQPFMKVMYTKEDGSDINNLSDLIESSKFIPVKQKYSMYYLYTISRFLSSILQRLEYRGNFYPYLREFFFIYLHHDKKYILGRKTWDPVKP